MLTIGRLSSAGAAAEYYLTQAGCPADYYLARGEPVGMWMGRGAATLGLAGPFASGAGEAFRALLAGRAPDGTVLVEPVMRSDPRGSLPAAALLESADAARVADLPEELSTAWGRLAAEVAADRRRSRLPRASVPVQMAGRFAEALGLNLASVYGPDALATAMGCADGRVDVRRCGLDLTLSAPKSVSVLFGLGGDDIVAQVRAAHAVAVGQVIAYLEGLVATAQRGHNSASQRATRVAGEGLVAAGFEHHVSRAGDPQLHTHVVVANLVRGPDGRWSAIDTREAYRQAQTGGYLYQAVLRGELTRRLGVRWGPVRRGVAEIDGVPAGLRRVFSQRRAAIQTELEARGVESARAAQVAAYATRGGKVRTPLPVLRQEWADRARAEGHDPQVRVRVCVGQTQLPVGLEPDAAAVAARVFGPDGVTARTSTFDRRDLLRAVATAVPTGSPVTVADLRALATRLVRDREVVPVTTAPAGERWYSTADLLAVERDALTLADARREEHRVSVTEPALAAALAEAALTGAQRAAVTALCSSGAGVHVLVGPAGSGKTAALAAAAAAWRSAGHEVTGAAVAAIAARQLADGAAIPSMSLAKLLTQHARSGAACAGVLVVDEAGMVGTRTLARLIRDTHAAGTKLVLVGDPHQLPELEAGGLFAALANGSHAPVAALGGNVRQAAAWERDALRALRDGDVLAAVDALDTHGRLTLAADVPACREALLADWATAVTARDPRQVLIVTSRRADARRLNTAARGRARQLGVLAGPDRCYPTATGRPLTLAVGDLVVVTANDYGRGVFNGTRAVVRATSPEDVRIDTGAGSPVTVTASELWQGRLEPGYALTVHRAQGLTVDVCLLFGTDALTREAGYVALSRGRERNTLYASWDSLHPEREPDQDLAEARLLPGAATRDAATRAAAVERLEMSRRQRLASDIRAPEIA